MLRSTLLAGVAVLLAGAPAFAFNRTTADYNPRASAKAARTWRYEAQSLAPSVSGQAALDPQGPTVVASRPVPDTPANRARFGEPMSDAGRMTQPIGD